MVRIAIVGYGKMGHMIESVAKEQGIETVSVDIKGADYDSLPDLPLDDIDACIDFTSPAAVMDNISFYCKNKINAVIGTTGWYDKVDKVKKMVEASGIGLIYASNFSIGVNILYKIVDAASRIIDHFDDYDAAGHEFHHNQKLDSPSGTAKSIANIMLKNIKRKKHAIYSEVNRKIKDDELHFSSTRVGSIPGTHCVIFDSPADTIEIKHTARSRIGFASGAVHAGRWISGKKGFFEIEDMMDDMFR